MVPASSLFCGADGCQRGEGRAGPGFGPGRRLRRPVIFVTTLGPFVQYRHPMASSVE